MTHVSEFQRRILQLIHPLVSSPDVVKVRSDNPCPSLANAYLMLLCR
jgi:hypothetical protein